MKILEIVLSLFVLWSISLIAEQEELNVEQKHRLVNLYYKTSQPYENLRLLVINEELTDEEIHCADTMSDHFKVPFLDP